MERELATGIIILLIALSALPASYIIARTQPDIGIITWEDIISQIPFYGGGREYIDGVTLNLSQYPDITGLSIYVNGTNTLLKIRRGQGYIVKVSLYKSKSTPRNGEKEYTTDISWKYYEDTNKLDTYVEAGNLIVEIYANPNLLNKLVIDMENGVLDIDLRSLNNTSLDLRMLNGVFRCTLQYIEISSVEWTLNIMNGVGRLNLITPTELSVDIGGYLINGYISLNMYGAHSYSFQGALIVPGDKDYSLKYGLENVNIEINLMRGYE